MRDFRLYVILDADVCKAHGDIEEIARKIILGGAEMLQLRAKHLPDRQVLTLGQTIWRLAGKAKTLFILNDRADLAFALDADGVHLGQNDLPVKEARKILGKNKIIGFSTHSVEQAEQAETLGADYLSIGPIFATALKPEVLPLTAKIIAQVKDKVSLPFVAVGGINLDNLDEILQQGTQRVAVCRAIITAKDVLSATKQFRQKLYS